MGETLKLLCPLVRSVCHFTRLLSRYFLLVVLLSGCGSTSVIRSSEESNYSQVVRTYIHPACSGQIVVVTPDKQDEFIYVARPETFAGSANKISIPIGRMIRNRAEDVFGCVFGTSPGQNESVNSYIITPVYKKFTYGFNSSFSAAAMTMVLDMEVIVKKADGTVLSREQFHETSKTSITAGRDCDEIATFGFDKLIFNIMLKAANKTVVQIASTGTAPATK